MNRFATSEEPGGTFRPAPAHAPAGADADGAVAAVGGGVHQGSPATWRQSARAVATFVKGISGLDAYERYARHQHLRHPDEAMMDEAEFWRCRWDADGKNPKARCC